MTPKNAVSSIILVCMLMAQGCAGTVIAPPPKVQTNFFVNAEQMVPAPERSPYALNWHEDPELLAALKQRYSQLYVPPVNTEFLEQDGRPLTQEAVNSLASYFRAQFVKAIERDSHGHFKVVDRHDAETLMIELALIKLVPTKSEINVIENVGIIFVPGAAPLVAVANLTGGAAAHEIGKGRIAMAMKVTDPATGKLIAEVYDEREDRAALFINFQDFTRFGNAHRIIEDWASEFTGLLNTPESTKISKPWSWGLILW